MPCAPMRCRPQHSYAVPSTCLEGTELRTARWLSMLSSIHRRCVRRFPVPVLPVMTGPPAPDQERHRPFDRANGKDAGPRVPIVGIAWEFPCAKLTDKSYKWHARNPARQILDDGRRRCPAMYCDSFQYGGTFEKRPFRAIHRCRRCVLVALRGLATRLYEAVLLGRNQICMSDGGRAGPVVGTSS
jgi:hypothetical protein